MERLELGAFGEAIVTGFGSAPEGESQSVRISHDCPEADEPIAIQTGFGKILAGERIIECADCSGTVTITKKSGIIYYDS